MFLFSRFISFPPNRMFGVTLWEIFSFAREPWAGFTGSQIIQKLEKDERLTIPNACPKRIFQAMQLCWHKEPNQRPTFASLYKFFSDSKPIKVKVTSSDAVQKLDQAKALSSNGGGGDDHQLVTYLNFTVGDEIEVIDSQPENFWWKGQSQKTFSIGYFPCNVTKDLRSLTRNGISKPLKNSFIHTGHMDSSGAKSWGNPSFIEKMYLDQPVVPPEVYEFNSSVLPPLELKTRVPTKNGNQNGNTKECVVDKILNLEELDADKNMGPIQEDAPANDVLIDFDAEPVAPILKPSPSRQINSTLNFNHKPSLVNDFNSNGFDFVSSTTVNNSNNQELFDLNMNGNISVVPILNKSSTFSSHAFSIGSRDASNTPKSFKSMSKELTLEPYRDPPPPIPVEGPIVDPNGAYIDPVGKYYFPPADSVVSSSCFNSQASCFNEPQPSTSCSQQPQSVYGRYYSSVCTDCNATTGSGGVPPASRYSCFTEINDPPILPHSSPYNLYSSDQYSQHPVAVLPELAPSTSAYAPNGQSSYFNEPTSTTTTSNNFNANPFAESSTNRPVYKTQLCKEFIEELESNFSGMAKIRLSEQEVSSSCIPDGDTVPSASGFPVNINPPPQSSRNSKVRRPAPPPPIVRKK